MYELSRVRLYSVGPSGARYQDITLDLRDVGDPVAKPTVPATLFDTQYRILRRPSPASVLFAENGNGKTVLVKLIFSVMLPGRKHIVGTSNTKAMDNFVLADDVAQVALEWMHVDTGELIVTGKASAWRDHRVSNDSNRLSEAWYAFRPTDGFALDDLPFVENGRLIELPGFRDRLDEASRIHPHLEMVWETQHRDWTQKLDSLGLDPELFAYQRRMNAGEGEAANAFSFKSDEAFVDWLLTSVLDKEGPRSMSEVIDAYGTRLAERDEVIAERDFVSGALDRLTPLAAAAHDYTAAQDIQAEAARNATRLVIALDLRQRSEAAQLAQLVAQQAGLNEQVERADRDQRRLNRIVLELRRIVAGLRLDEARKHEELLVDERVTAQNVLDAWQATDALLRFQDLHEQAEAVREAIRQQEQDAKGPLAARDTAARRLVHGLIHAANVADDAAHKAEIDATALVAQIKTAAEEETEHHKAAEQFRAAALNAQEKISILTNCIQEAVAEGLLAADEDLPAAAQRAEEVARVTAETVTTTDQEAVRLRRLHRTAEATLRTRGEQATAARRAASDAARDHKTARAATTALAGEARLTALLGADEIFLDTDANALDDRFGTTLKDAEAERDRLRDADREDQRILDALGTGGLLPPPAAVTTARDTLRDAGITCYSGWEYLAQVREDARDTVLRHFPHLVGGVVLNNPGQAGAAEEILAEARLLPATVVAVGATATFEDLSGQPPIGMQFLVQPNPALYDEDLAEAERHHIEAIQAERLVRLDAVNAQIEDDKRLRARLAQWRESYPPGTLDRLTDAKDTTEAAATKAEGAAEEAQNALNALTEQEDTVSEALPGLRVEAQAARATADRITALASEHTQLPSWINDLHANQENTALAEATAVRKHQTAERLRARKEEAVRLRDDHKRTAQAHRHEITQTPGGGEVNTTVTPPAETIETLKSIYRAAVAAYEKVQVGADLKADLEAKEHAEAESQAAVENLPTRVRAMARNLLASPDGGDGPARAAASDRARRRIADLDRAIRDANTTVGSLKTTYEQFQAQETTLDPYGRPTSIEHGEELVSRANADWNTATTRHSEIKAKADALHDTVDHTSREAEAFGTLVDTLRDSLPEEPVDPETHAAYAGVLNDARVRRDAVRQALRQADGLLAETTTEVRSAADALNRYATDDRFVRVGSPVRRQILSVEMDRLYEYGPDWEDALKPRLRSLQDELAQIDRHRNQIVLSLRGHVETALRTLKAAERVSQLPETLGDWAGQHFLRIRFKDPDPATLNEHLATVVDQAVTPDKPSGKRDGMSILLKGVRAALPRGVRVEMLKPDTTLRTERVRINEVSDVFSGGQELTAAIILYCTMAALRANDRGRIRNKHAGVLFLDNPIGRASAGYLLELQLGVASELGVQLIYTTGLFDLNALSVFPLIIRLRNDQDVRSGKKYLTVDDEIRRQLTVLGEPDGTGRITAARLFRRPGDEPATAPSTAGQVG